MKHLAIISSLLLAGSLASADHHGKKDMMKKKDKDHAAGTATAGDKKKNMDATAPAGEQPADAKAKSGH